MKKSEILQFIYNRMTNIHNENENFDYIIRFKEIIKTIKEDEKKDLIKCGICGTELNDKDKMFLSPDNYLKLCIKCRDKYFSHK